MKPLRSIQSQTGNIFKRASCLYKNKTEGTLKSLKRKVEFHNVEFVSGVAVVSESAGKPSPACNLSDPSKTKDSFIFLTVQTTRL